MAEMENKRTGSSARKRFRRILKWGGFVVLVLIGAIVVTARMAGIGCAGRHSAPLAQPTTTRTSDLLAGDWRGTWASSERDMGGAMTCQVRKLESDVYEATFDATFFKYWNNHSVIKLRVTKSAGEWKFSGQEDLGLLKGGVYKYSGRCDGKDFVCTYDSKHDQGIFTMTRSRPGNAP